MDKEFRDIWSQLEIEFVRLGVDPKTCPVAGASAGALPRLLAGVRALQPPKRWRDILPRWPEHWDETDPETWTIPHKSRGPHDQAEYPFGPLFTVWLRHDTTEADLQSLASEARGLGHPVHGVGFETRSPTLPEHRLAEIVLEVGTTEEQFEDFSLWLDHLAIQFTNWHRGVNAPPHGFASYHLSYPDQDPPAR